VNVNSPILGMSSDLTKKDRMSAAFRGAAGNRTRSKKTSELRKAQSDYANTRKVFVRKVLTASTSRPLFDDESCGFTAGRGAATSGGSRPKSGGASHTPKVLLSPGRHLRAR
jgi:hypothetical protein